MGIEIPELLWQMVEEVSEGLREAHKLEWVHYVWRNIHQTSVFPSIHHLLKQQDGPGKRTTNISKKFSVGIL